MDSVDIRNFVDINIINKKETVEINSTRDTVILFTLDDSFIPVSTTNNGYKEYSSLEEMEAVTGFNAAWKLKSVYQYAKVFFENGGVKLLLADPNVIGDTHLTEMHWYDILPYVKELPNEIIVVAVDQLDIDENTNLSLMAGLANEYSKSTVNGFKVYGINEKYFLSFSKNIPVSGTVGYMNEAGTSEITVKLVEVPNLALKIANSRYSDDIPYQVGTEMTIAAYLSQIDVYKPNSIKDYAFTQEIVSTDFGASFNINTMVKNVITKHANISVDINGIIRNIGGDLTTGEDLVNKYVLIILHQTLSQRVMEVLTQKLKGNDAITAIYAAMSRELNRYLSSGYLTTDKAWTNNDLTIVKNNITYTLITKGTALVQGYKITILPYASLTSAEISEHKVPYIYVVLADSYNIRKATIYGETI